MPISEVDADPASPEFQLVLKALIDVYRPILEEDLKRADNLDALSEEANRAPPDCEAELATAERLLGSFPDEQVVLALLPLQARELLGPIERWRWCLTHIRCCMIFGWLVCRRPRSFRLLLAMRAQGSWDTGHAWSPHRPRAARPEHAGRSPCQGVSPLSQRPVSERRFYFRSCRCRGRWRTGLQ